MNDDAPGGRRDAELPTGVLLMSFGTAATLDDVPAYLAHVRGGRAAPPELVAEFRRRFALVGGSPLTRITCEQAAALEAYLNGRVEERRPTRRTWRVAVGMRHAPPFIAEGLRDLVAAGVRRIVGVVMSPQYSPIIMSGYLRALAAARADLPPEVEVKVAGPWHRQPAFVSAMAGRVRAALAEAPDEGRTMPVLFTAHSLPRSVAQGEPDYLEQLQDTARAIAARARLPAARWQFAYQSAGHTPEPWLTPDVTDLLPALRAAGHRSALVAPVQFLADHLEVLYDIDVAAREQARAQGIRLLRTASLNTHLGLIEALAAVVRCA